MTILKSLHIISLVGLISLPHLASGMNAGQQFFNQHFNQPQQNAGGNQAPNQNQGGGIPDTFIRIATGLMQGVADGTVKAVNAVGSQIETMRENSRIAAEKRRNELQIIIDTYPADSKIRQNAEAELDTIAQQQKELNDTLNKMQAGGTEILLDSAKMGTQAMGEWVNSQIRMQEKKQAEDHEERLQTIESEANRDGMIRSAAVTTRLWLNDLADPTKLPNLMLKVGGLSAALFGTYYGIKFGFQVLEDWYRIPDLADKTTIVPWYTKMRNWLSNNKVFATTLDDVVLEPELKAFFKDYVISTKNIIKNGGHLRHLLLPGPPGTGKTLSSMAMANELGLPCIYFSASNLRNFKVEDAITKLRQLFAYAENSSVPIVVIIDESEVVFASRDKALSEETRMIMNQIMAKTGTEQCNFILVALTNRPQDFDDAFKSRFSETVYIGAPALEQRRQIVDMYVTKYIKKPLFTPKTSFLGRLRTKKGLKQITFDEAIFTEQAINSIAQRLEGFTGRDISQLMMAVRDAAYATPEVHVTQAMLDTIMARKIEKKRQEEGKDVSVQPQVNKKK